MAVEELAHWQRITAADPKGPRKDGKITVTLACSHEKTLYLLEQHMDRVAELVAKGVRVPCEACRKAHEAR